MHAMQQISGEHKVLVGRSIMGHAYPIQMPSKPDCQIIVLGVAYPVRQSAVFFVQCFLQLHLQKCMILSDGLEPVAHGAGQYPAAC